MMTSDPTTTDAVTMLQRLHARTVHRENHGDAPRIGSDEVLAVLRLVEAEVSTLQSRLKRVEEESKGWQRTAVSLERRLIFALRTITLLIDPSSGLSSKLSRE